MGERSNKNDFNIISLKYYTRLFRYISIIIPSQVTVIYINVEMTGNRHTCSTQQLNITRLTAERDGERERDRESGRVEHLRFSC